MKLRVIVRTNFNHSISFGGAACHPLYSNVRILIRESSGNFSRVKLRVVVAVTSLNWGKVLFSISVYTYWPWSILWILPEEGSVKYWVGNLFNFNRHRFLRLCSALRTNILLSRYSNYKLIICSPICWRDNSTVGVRRICCRLTYASSILCFTLFIAFCCNSASSITYFFFTLRGK